MAKTSLALDKFIQAGVCISDLSKCTMYGFHYEVMKRQIFPNERIILMYGDTDSFTYSIQTSSLVERLSAHKEHFDFSEYPEDHRLYSLTNKKVLGKMKDEVKGEMMTEFCALKAKLYSFVIADNHQFKKAKGVKKNVVRKTFVFQVYLDCLRTGQLLYREMASIRSYNHEIHTIQQKKIALSAFDDKRCIQEDGIRTLAWVHYSIPREEDLLYLLNFQSNEFQREDEWVAKECGWEWARKGREEGYIVR